MMSGRRGSWSPSRRTRCWCPPRNGQQPADAPGRAARRRARRYSGPTPIPDLRPGMDGDRVRRTGRPDAAGMGIAVGDPGVRLHARHGRCNAHAGMAGVHPGGGATRRPSGGVDFGRCVGQPCANSGTGRRRCACGSGGTSGGLHPERRILHRGHHRSLPLASVPDGEQRAS